MAEPVALFAVLFTLFALLRSHDLTAVDGAVRAFSVYHNPAPQFHGSSHMLYPMYVLVWTRAAHFLGFSIADPISFIRVAQAMNCFFAAFCAALLLAILRSLNVSRWIAFSASMGWAFSRAVVLHATNSAEPLPGLFWSVIALACTIQACRSRRMWLVPVAGFSLAMAMATYQTMVLMAIACGLMTLIWTWGLKWQAGAALRAVSLLTFSFLFSLIAICGISFYAQHTQSVSEALHVFLNSPDRGVFGGFAFSKVANITTGYVSNLVLCFPPDGQGLRNLIRHRASWLPLFAISVVCFSGVYATLAVRFAQMRRIISDDYSRVVVAVFGSLAALILLMCYWNSLYDKMWIQPLWLIFLTGAIFAQCTRGAHPWLGRAAGVLVLAIIVSNLTIATHDARGRWPNVDEASRVKTFVRGNDLVVSDWNAVSTIYQTMWAPQNTWDFISASGTYRSGTPEELKHQIVAAQHRGGSVYFLGLLDENRKAWDPMLGLKCGIPYESLAAYREGSTVVASFRSGGQVITLRRFDASL